MRLCIRTKVSADLAVVKSRFNEELFLKLSPPFPKVALLRFDGCETGHVVALQLNFLFFKQVWKSEIMEDNESAEEWYFVDRGVELPFFLKGWTHRHVVNSLEVGSEVMDEIDYSTGTVLTDVLMYPLMMLQFLYRKPIYRKVLKKKRQLI